MRKVHVPSANMEEILPAARLLSRAAALTPSDYDRAKAGFLSGVDASKLAAQACLNPRLIHFLACEQHADIS